MAPVTATTIGQLGQNLLQGSSPSLTTLRKEAEEEQKPRRWLEERSEAHRHCGCVKQKQNKLQQVKDDEHWQSLLTVTGVQEKAASGHGALWHTQMTKTLLQKELHLLIPFWPANPSSWRQTDTTPHLTAPPRCAVFQEVIYLPTSIFVRPTCSLKHNENSLPDQFVSEVSWLPAPLWAISFCLHVRTISLATA